MLYESIIITTRCHRNLKCATRNSTHRKVGKYFQNRKLEVMGTFYEAISLYRRRNYSACIDKCNVLLLNRHSGTSEIDQKGPWELKMRAMTQRVYVDDIEADDGYIDDDDDGIGSNRLATAPRPGTSMRTATAAAAMGTSSRQTSTARPRTTTGRALTGMARPGTVAHRPGSSMPSRSGTGGRIGTAARNVRLGSASIYALGDPTADTFQTSRLDPQKFAVDPALSMVLFNYMYYHEGDIRKALAICEAVAEARPNAITWWWHTQRGRCHIMLGNPRDAERHLRAALAQWPHPDTALLLARVYKRLDQPLAALETLDAALQLLPNDVSLLTQQGRIFEMMDNLQASARMYRHIAQLDPVNAEALAAIAVHHFYAHQPELALMYYRRILSMGMVNCELYCNIGLCCLYGGQLDLVMLCFQRAMRAMTTNEQRADVWYNLSFVAMNTGDFNLARRCLRLCISMDGSHGSALNNLAVLTARTGALDRAKSYFLAAKSVMADNVEIQKNNARIEMLCI